MHINQSIPPAQLFIGQHAQAVEAVEALLQGILCLNNSCNTCVICMQIREKQHHAIMWLLPEKNYTLDHFEDLFATLTFQQEPGQHFFFIIQKADFLTAACANKLLKPMEEPPAGYHFILLAEHPEQILPTIKSRCMVHTLDKNTASTVSHPLLDVFTHKLLPSNEFSKLLDGANVNERESIEILDQILSYWFTLYNQNHDEKVFCIIQKLQQMQLQPPMPGSSVTFWRNVYLQTYDLMAQHL